ncbi:MAG: TIGR00153 family protein [Halieaceae bacterium]|jgi:predicted phosphate transport protein (TIGR00153 family)|nr:TIGR00153 family protein [Halieaceae bacterium]
MAVGNSLSRLLGKSPLSPLQEHMRQAEAAVAVLPGLLAAAQAGDWEQARRLEKELRGHASEADRLKLELRMQLRKSLFMPVSRSDLLELLTSQDLVADHAESFASLMLSRSIQVPEKAFSQFAAFLAASASTCTLALEAVGELDEVFEVGFGKREIDLVYARLKAIAKQEKAARKLEAKLRAKLFALEKSLDPLDAMFLYQLVDKLDAIARGAERIGNRLLILISI